MPVYTIRADKEGGVWVGWGEGGGAQRAASNLRLKYFAVGEIDYSPLALLAVSNNFVQ